MFIWNSIPSRDYNLDVLHIEGQYSIPKKQYESIEVPGRTGNLLLDTGARLNKTITIQCCLICTGLRPEVIRAKINDIQEWLIGGVGYQVLEFRDGSRFNAIVSDAIEFNHITSDDVFTFDIKFECYEVM